MKKSYLALCIAGALPYLFSSAAFAQTTTAPAANNDGADNYLLKSNTVNPSSTSAQQGNNAAYELRGTSISGTASATPVILTVPVDPDMAAYKTESGLYLYPSAFVGYGYNDNLQTANTNTVGSSFFNVAPQLVAEMKNKGDRYTAFIGANTTRYTSSSDDNYTNSDINIAGDNYFSGRARMGWRLGQVNGTDPRGSNNRPLGTEPDKWHNTTAAGTFIYGANEAKGRVEFDLGSQAKVYDNNRVNTAGADFNVASYAGRFFYRLGTNTLAVAEMRNARNMYVSSTSTQSSNERRYYGGITWDATALTTGIFKIGRMTKDFDDSARQSYSGNSWEAAVRWAPKTYSMVELQTNKATGESTGLGEDYTVLTGTDLAWNHKWTNSLTSRVGLGVLVTDYVGTGIDRKDTANNFALTVDYQVLRWLKMGVDFTTTDSSSSVAGQSFKRNITMFTLNGTL